jgi:hypothetical protein
VRRRGRGRDLGQFVAEQEDRQALEPVDYGVGPQGGGDVVLPTESPTTNDHAGLRIKMCWRNALNSAT